jgi:hypothetical protein
MRTLISAAAIAVTFFTVPALAGTYIEERIIIQDDPGVALPYGPPAGVIVESPLASPPVVVTEDEEPLGPPLEYDYEALGPHIDIHVGE